MKCWGGYHKEIYFVIWYFGPQYSNILCINTHFCLDCIHTSLCNHDQFEWKLRYLNIYEDGKKIFIYIIILQINCRCLLFTISSRQLFPIPSILSSNTRNELLSFMYLLWYTPRSKLTKLSNYKVTTVVILLILVFTPNQYIQNLQYDTGILYNFY